MSDINKNIVDGNLVMTFKVSKQKRNRKTVLNDEEGQIMNSNEPKAQALDIHNGSSGRIPRISRLMALAIHLQRLLDDGVIKDCAEIARIAGLTRARVSQIMNLNLLAPQIQEEIIFLPKIMKGIDTISEHSIRKIVLKPRWNLQIKDWQKLMKNAGQSFNYPEFSDNSK